MKLQLLDKELTVEVEAGEVLEWDGAGVFRVHPKLARGEPWVSPIRATGGTTHGGKFDGVTPEMEQK